MMLRRLLPHRGLMIAMLAAASMFLLAGAALSPHSASHAQTATPSGGSAPQGSPANSNPVTVGANGSRIHCDDIPEARGGVLLGKIVPCLTRTIETTSQQFSRKMIEWMQPIFYAFLTFVIVMFGLKVLQNEGQLQTHAIVLLLKIGFALSILALIPGTLIPATYGIMAESQAAIMNTIGPEQSSIHCDIAHYQGAQTPLVWAQMDCLMGKLYGFATGSDVNGASRPNMILASSIIGLLSGFFFSGTFGVALFFLCIGVLVSMFMMVVRVVMAFVNSYLFIALYMILAPLLLPLMFLKVTTPYFEKWYQGIIAALLMPLMICAYVMFAMLMYDKLMFAPDALVNKLFDPEWIQLGQELPSQVCDRNLLGSTGFRAEASGKSEQETYNGVPWLRNILDPLSSAGNNPCAAFRASRVNLEATPDKGNLKSAREKFTRLFRDCVLLFLMAWLIEAGFKTLTGSLRFIVGSGAVVFALNDAKSPQEARLSAGFGRARQGITDALGGRSGMQFIEGLPQAARDSVGRPGGTGFMSGVSRR